MKHFALTVFLSFTVISSCICSSVDILEPNGDVCLGAPVTLTCTVNGTALGWRYGGAAILYAAMDGNTSSTLLGSGPFSTRVTNVSGGIITSIATASNLTRDVNGMTLECSNGLFTSNVTEKENITLPLQVPSEPSSSDATFENSTCIKLTWSGTACVRSYSIVTNNTSEDIVNGQTYFYCPQSSGDYIFQVASINYFGERVPGSDNAVYHWQEPESIYFITDSNRSGLSLTVKDDDDSNRPPITSCSVTLNDEARPCEIDVPLFFNISFGLYTYNVTVGNDVGRVYRIGSLFFERPTETSSPTANGTTSFSVSPIEFAASFIALGVSIILFVCWIVLRICWKKHCCCPRVWRNDFWLIFFCYDCCTYDDEEKERNAIGLNNPNVGGEKGNDTPL